jgi:hypothetical protein
MIRALCDRRYVCTDEWYEVADCADSRPHVNAQTEYGTKKRLNKVQPEKCQDIQSKELYSYDTRSQCSLIL